MIIVEGMDNSGKSTLVKTLSKSMGLLALNNRVKLSSPAEFRAYTTDMIELSRGYPVIFDRWPGISEWVYGPILRGISHITKEALRLHLFWLNDRGFQIVYCRPPTDDLLNWGSEDQREGVQSNARSLITKYDRVMDDIYASGDIPFHLYNYRYHTVEQLQDQLTKGRKAWPE